MRRIIFSYASVMLVDYPIFQIYALFFQSMIVMTFLLAYQPFSEPKLNRLEFFNEACIYLVSCCALSFTDLGNSSQMSRYDNGWVVIFTVFANIIINLYVMLETNVRLIWAKI